MKRLNLFPWMLGLALLLGGCVTQPEAPVSLHPVDQSSIVGRWEIQTLDGRPAQVGSLILSFRADRRMTGTINCNTVGSAYEVRDGRVIFVGEGSITTLGCRGFPDLTAAERVLFLSSRAWVSADHQTLVFENGSRLVFRRTADHSP